MTPYRRHHGDSLTPGEAAQLLTREAQGEAVNFVPVRRGPRFVLAHRATLTPVERAAHLQRLAEYRSALHAFTAPALSA